MRRLSPFLISILAVATACSSKEHACHSEPDTIICAKASAQCGAITVEECGSPRVVDCGSCSAPQTCGGGGVANVCGCESDAALCSRLRRDCDRLTAVDSCGVAREVDCGACASGLVCGAAGVPNRCDDPALICGPDAWCWEHPRPQGGAIAAVWMLSGEEAWAVGDFGLSLHWDGKRWARFETQTQEHLKAVWGSGSNDVWAVGNHGTILRWNGGSWAKEPWASVEDLLALWGSGPNDVWAVGNPVNGAARVIHWEGQKWNAVALQSSQATRLAGIWGSSANDVWAVGDVGAKAALLHWNGTAWSAQSVTSPTQLLAVWGTSPTDVWAGGRNGGMVHWDGIGWSSVPTPVAAGSGNHVRAIWGSQADSVFAFGIGLALKWDGSAWSAMERTGAAGAQLYGAHGLGSRGWAVGHSGDMRWFEGGRWSRLHPVIAEPWDRLWYVTGTSDSDVWVVGYRSDSGAVLARWDGSAWSTFSAPTDRGLVGVWASAANDVWAVGSGGTVLRFDGSGWQTLSLTRTGNLLAVAGTSSDDVWIGGENSEVLHWDGSRWRDHPTSAGVNAIWARASDDVWFVGDRGLVLRWDGKSLSAVTSPISDSLLAVQGRSPTDVWISSSAGPLLHWDGQALTKVDSPVPDTIFGFCGRELDALLAVSLGGDVLRWDGASWTVTSTQANSLAACWVAPGGDVWAVGPDRAVLRRRR